MSDGTLEFHIHGNSDEIPVYRKAEYREKPKADEVFLWIENLQRNYF